MRQARARLVNRFQSLHAGRSLPARTGGDMRERVRCDTVTVVDYANGNRATVGLHVQRYLSTVVRKLGGIRQQVCDHLQHPRPIGVQPNRRIRERHGRLVAPFLEHPDVAASASSMTPRPSMRVFCNSSLPSATRPISVRPESEEWFAGSQLTPERATGARGSPLRDQLAATAADSIHRCTAPIPAAQSRRLEAHSAMYRSSLSCRDLFLAIDGFNR